MAFEIKTDKDKLNAIVAIGELGTQFFWFNKTSKQFEYALPLVSGGEYGGDTETFEAPEMDDDTVAKISGRTTLSDLTYTSNYTAARYERWTQILDNSTPQVYCEVFSDGSAVISNGTSGMPTIQGGDVRQIEVTVAPQGVVWVDNILAVTDYAKIAEINAMFNAQGAEGTVLTKGEDATGVELPFDLTTLPSNRIGKVSDKAAE